MQGWYLTLTGKQKRCHGSLGSIWAISLYKGLRLWFCEVLSIAAFWDLSHVARIELTWVWVSSLDSNHTSWGCDQDQLRPIETVSSHRYVLKQRVTTKKQLTSDDLLIHSVSSCSSKSGYFLTEASTSRPRSSGHAFLLSLLLIRPWLLIARLFNSSRFYHFPGPILSIQFSIALTFRVISMLLFFILINLKSNI